MPFVEDDDIYPTLVALAARTEEELAATSNPVKFVTVTTGDQPVIEHAGLNGNCGELIVSLLLAYPLGNDLEQDNASQKCSFVRGFEVVVSTFRCAPNPRTVRNAVTAPSSEDYLASAREVTADLRAMQRAICKALKGRQYGFRQYQPYGPEGGVVGGSWTVIVGPVND